MKTLEAKDLAKRSDEILRLVKEGETVEIVDEGQVVARVVPPEESRRRDQKEVEAFIDAMDRIENEVSRHITGPVDAVEMIRDIRRDL